LRVRVRENWHPLPDVCVYHPDFGEERYPSVPPLLWVENLSHDDRMVDVWNKANELVANGVPYVWIINPETLESELRTSAGWFRSRISLCACRIQKSSFRYGK
jgi:Uma2 family endonuclease